MIEGAGSESEVGRAGPYLRDRRRPCAIRPASVRGGAMRATWIWIGLAAGLTAGCAQNPQQTPLNAFAATPSGGLARLAADIEAHGEIDTALGLYQRAAEEMSSPSAYVRLGEAYARAARIEPAIGAFRSALAIDPDNGDALLGLGSALARKNALADAIVVLEKAVAYSDTAGSWNRLGLAQILAGRLMAGRDALARASRLKPTDQDILSNLALAEALLGHNERAIELEMQVVGSGLERHHVPTLVIALVLAHRPADAREIAGRNLSRRDADDLLSRVVAIRAMRTPEARALALGRLIG
jgi:Flp pilus assembly protein TadD